MEHRDFSHPKTPAEYLRLFLTGFAMGSADIVPGVSGGTIAFISGVYETLLNAIKSFDLTALRLGLKFDIKGLLNHIPWQFLLALGLGIGVAVLTLSSILENLLETQPTYVFAFFGGLIIASVVAIGFKVKWTVSTIIALIVGAIAAFLIAGLEALNPATVSHELPVLFLSGVIAIMAMILPGISGSFILLILGQYEYILAAVTRRDIVSLIAVALGCAVGIIGFSRILSWLLKHYEQLTIATLVGFMLGSLRTIWDRASAGTELMPEFGATEIIIAVVLVIVGFLFVSLIDHVASGDNPVFRGFWNRQPEAAK